VRVALDYDPALRGHAGIARYVRRLTTHLLEEGGDLHLFLLGSTTAGMPRHPRVTAVAHGLSPKAWRLRLLAAHYLGWSADPLLPKVDIFHATDYAFPPESPNSGRVVVTVHDVSAVTTPDTLTLMNRMALQLFFRRLKQCQYQIVAPSASVAKQVVRLLRYNPTQVTVVPLGVASQ
jgi:hypothetical protein